MSRIEDELSIKHKEAVDELRKRVIDDVPSGLKDDKFLYLRFLRARDFNIDLAEDMLRNHLIWRKVNQIDSVMTFQQNDVDKNQLFSETSSPAEKEKARKGIVLKYLPLARIGFDKDGNPIRYFAFGDMDSKGLLKCVKKSVVIKSVIRCFEEDVIIMKEQTAKLGKPIEQWTYIFDFENYSFSKATHKPTLETLISLFLAYEANYPERLKAGYAINASVYFTIIFSVIKPLLSGATINKIKIFGKDGWKDELLQHIDADVLPAFLGGKKTDPDGNPLCNTTVKHGHLVPEELYISNQPQRLSSQADVKKLTVARMSKITLYLDVNEAGSMIEWEFETVGKDIGFELLYKVSNCDDQAKELVPNQRVETQLASEVGTYHCEFPGTYIMVFDNTYSWIHEKDVYYRTSVISPKIQKNLY